MPPQHAGTSCGPVRAATFGLPPSIDPELAMHRPELYRSVADGRIFCVQRDRSEGIWSFAIDVANRPNAVHKDRDCGADLLHANLVRASDGERGRVRVRRAAALRECPLACRCRRPLRRSAGYRCPSPTRTRKTGLCILALQGRGLGVKGDADRLGMTDATVRRYLRQANGYQAKQREPAAWCLTRGDSGRQQKSYASAVSTRSSSSTNRTRG